MIRQLLFVLLDVGNRSVESLLFAGEEHKADGAARAFPGANDGVRGGKDNGGATAVVGGTFGQIPRVQMPASDEDLLGLLGFTDFTDHVVALDWPIRKSVLDVDAGTRSDAAFQEALQLALIFSGHGYDRQGKVFVKTKDAGMG